MEDKITKKRPSLYSKFEKKNFLFCYVIILLPVVNFMLFWFYKNISSIFLAFQDGDGMFTLDNFNMVWRGFTSQDKFGHNLTEALGKSVLIWSISAFLSTPISIITTYVLTCKIRGHNVLRICYIIPGLMGTLIWVALVKYMLQFNGPIVQLLTWLGVDLPKAATRNGLLAAEETAFVSLITINFVTGLVGNNAVLTGAFSRVPDELFESAELDGAGYWRTCFNIAIPCIWSTITMNYIFSLTGVFTADCSAWLYSNGTGEPGLTTMGFQLFYLTYEIAESGGTSDDYGYPAALGFTLTMFTLPVVLIGRWILEKIQDAVEV